MTDYIDQLKECKTKKEFKELWDPKKYSWFYSSLAEHCSEYFNIWWDPNKFEWWNSDLLMEYCQKYKNIWIQEYIIRKLNGTIK